MAFRHKLLREQRKAYKNVAGNAETIAEEENKGTKKEEGQKKKICLLAFAEENELRTHHAESSLSAR